MKADKLHEKFMSRCLELAFNGIGRVAPNPMVGAVIVYNDKIIGEGFHVQYGRSHAEVNAIQSVKNKSLLQESTLYVNLEPCAHIGKTPPCSDLIIAEKVPKVIIGTSDPNLIVAGKGIKKLKDNGVEVIVDVLADECRELNRRFFTFHEKKRPYILLKWAQSADGYIDTLRKPGEPIGPNWISNPISRTLVHRWRTEEQAIMAGTNTVLIDNPELNARYWQGNNPLRVIPDRNLRIPNTSNVFNNSSETLIFNEIIEKRNEQIEYLKINFSTGGIENILDELYKRQIMSLMVEGGKKLLESFLQKNLWDEARIFVGEKKFGKGIEAPIITNKIEKSEFVLNDQLLIYRNRNYTIKV